MHVSPAPRLKELGPGIGASAAAVLLALVIHALLPSLPAMTAAVVLGILAANLPFTAPWVSGRLRPGLSFAGKHFMRAGIVLLGLKLSLGDVVALGWQTAALVVAVVLLSFAGTFTLGKLFRLEGDTPLLIATGFSICGASAIGAMGAVKGTPQRDTVLPVALVTLCGTLAIGVLPLLMQPLHLTALGFGRWVGASVHDVGQVVATAQTAGAVALSAAVIIKLTRVVLLAPMVATVGLLERRRHVAGASAGGAANAVTVARPGGSAGVEDGVEEGAHPDDPANAANGVTPDNGTRSRPGLQRSMAPGKFPPVVPLFVLGFLLMIVLRSLGWVPSGAQSAGNLLQDLALGAALFGLGSAVSIRQLLRTGLRASLMALCAWLLIAALGYAAVLLMAGTR
ncbi:putative sulfate exporter family transporter [Paenarthrobacter sp. Z7-10]|uniref:YeiH family protein n=1 Tax=Paenarthrobacter sp. Z7-10 TaxID=2787635 RepID=UPI0022A967B1|nr:putative sulfate exporter family transporter [Paenarthrobacter sp. Z7-10]MCZ2402634.1 putative sulfate exporter family transporter [Paenarthrobacter sp. Z7-10]